MTDDVEQFAGEFVQFMRSMHEAAERRPVRRAFRERIDEFLGVESRSLPVISDAFAAFDHVNVQVAMSAYLGRKGRSHELLGMAGGYRHVGSFSDILLVPAPDTDASVEYRNLPSGPESKLPCVQFGIFLIANGERRLVVLMRGPDRHGMQSNVTLEVTSPDEATSQGFLQEIRALIGELNVFRGQVLTFGGGGDFHQSGLGPIVFLDRPQLAGDQLILPADALSAIEAQVFGIARHRERLLASGQHLKRGLLLHGPPGTGKTLTVSYLISTLREHTVVVLSGRGLGAIGAACGLARMLEPSVVVLEDVDLVAEERGRFGPNTNPVLFEVLNQMDGLDEDADVVFLLTTNRADRLEPALAARPGRVDLAVEVPLPDGEARRRLIELYGRGVDLRLDDIDTVVERTAGVTASFVKELMRKAALLSALSSEDAETGRIAVADAELNRALDELLAEETILTRRLLGGAPVPSDQGPGVPIQSPGPAVYRPGMAWLEAFEDD